MTVPLISVIIPCYNGASFVSEAIQSALDQTWQNTEVIVIDDGSTDESLEVIRSFGNRIRWATGPNLGGCAARNRGLELAKGNYVQFLDSDDLLCPDKIKWQIGLGVSANEVAVCNRIDLDMERQESREVFLSFDNENPFRSLLMCERLRTSAPLHLRDRLLEVGGFDEKLPCAQEYDLHLRLSVNGVRFIHHPRITWTARIREGSVSSSWGRVLEQHPVIFDKLIVAVRASWQEPERSSGLRWISEAAMRSARNAFGLQREEAGQRLLDIARKAHPNGGYGDFDRRIEEMVARSIGVERYCRLRKWLLT